MSTFGKKALIWWDYDVCKQEKPDLTRFDHSPENIQLAILEKYYPIGIKCKLWKTMWGIKEEPIDYTIKSYVKTMVGYRLELDRSSDILTSAGSNKITYKSMYTYHPMRVCPNDDWRVMLRRESKLEKIFKGK